MVVRPSHRAVVCVLLLGACVSADPDRIDFGPTLIGTASHAELAVVAGGSDVTVANPRILGKDRSSFSEHFAIPRPALDIPAGERETGTIQFSPTEERRYRGQFTVSAGQLSGFPVPLTGEGVEKIETGEIAFAAGVPSLRDPLDFEDVEVGRTKTLRLTLRNKSRAERSVLGDVRSGEGFRLVSPTGRLRVPGRGQVTVTIEFSPPKARNYQMTFFMLIDDPVKPGSRTGHAGIVLKGRGVSE